MAVQSPARPRRSTRSTRSTRQPAGHAQPVSSVRPYSVRSTGTRRTSTRQVPGVSSRARVSTRAPGTRQRVSTRRPVQRRAPAPLPIRAFRAGFHLIESSLIHLIWREEPELAPKSGSRLKDRTVRRGMAKMAAPINFMVVLFVVICLSMIAFGLLRGPGSPINNGSSTYHNENTSTNTGILRGK